MTTSTTKRPHVYLRDDGILQIDWQGIPHIKLHHMQDAYQQHIAISPQKLPVLFVGANILGYDREAVMFVSSPEVVAITLATAIVTRSLLEQYLSRMFIWYNKPPFPVRAFLDESSAIAWLKFEMQTASPK